MAYRFWCSIFALLFTTYAFSLAHVDLSEVQERQYKLYKKPNSSMVYATIKETRNLKGLYELFSVELKGQKGQFEAQTIRDSIFNVNFSVKRKNFEIKYFGVRGEGELQSELLKHKNLGQLLHANLCLESGRPVAILYKLNEKSHITQVECLFGEREHI